MQPSMVGNFQDIETWSILNSRRALRLYQHYGNIISTSTSFVFCCIIVHADFSRRFPSLMILVRSLARSLEEPFRGSRYTDGRKQKSHETKWKAEFYALVLHDSRSGFQVASTTDQHARIHRSLSSSYEYVLDLESGP